MEKVLAPPPVAATRIVPRLIRHHAALLAVSVLSVAALYFTRPYKDWISRLSFATAYPALALLVATLLIGPWNLLRKRRNPISSDLRRDVGIWAGILGLLHVAIGQNVHLRGRPWLYYVYSAPEHHTGLRHDVFGLANYTGLIATRFLLALLVTSNDASIRRLGTPRWKQLQRWNYAIFVLVAVHGIGYQTIEKQKLPFVSTLAVLLLLALVFQFAGVLRRRAAAART